MLVGPHIFCNSIEDGFVDVASITHHFIHLHSLPSYETYPSTFCNLEMAPKIKILVDLGKKIPNI
jgi:hypothetical protein